MAKYATRRSYKKRASKKRHTIRKLKKTMRRKMQRGGGPQEDAALFNAVFPLIQRILPGVFKLLMNNLGPLLQIFMLLGNAGVLRGGSKTRLTQRGGGLSAAAKEQLINKLNVLKINFKDKPELIPCIDKLIARFERETVDPNASVPRQEIAADTIDSSVIQTELDNAPAPAPASVQVSVPSSESPIDRFKRIFNDKVIGALDSKIERLRGFFNPEELDCLIKLKTEIVNDFKQNIISKLDELKTNPVVMTTINGVNALKDAVSGRGAAVMNRITELNDSERSQQVQNTFNNLKGRFFNHNST